MMFRSKKDNNTDVLELPTPTVASVLERESPPAPVAVMQRAADVIEEFEYDFDEEWLRAEVTRLAHERNSLYGIEGEAAVHIDARMAKLRQDQAMAAAFNKFEGKKRRLDPVVLSWRKKEPVAYGHVLISVPEVGLFGLDSPTLQLVMSVTGWSEWNPALPYGLKKQYDDISEQASAILSGMHFQSSLTMIARFSGLIPAETKEKIRAAKRSGAFSDIRLLAETDWVFDTVPNPYYADPIVVGLVHDEMWVIDIFDPTPLEDYIAKEFTS